MASRERHNFFGFSGRLIARLHGWLQRGCGFTHRAPALEERRHVGVHHRGQIQGHQLRECQPTHDRHTERPPGLAAGEARGVFLIDGRIVEAPDVTPPAEALLARIKMKPAEQRTLSIRTMPVGGSAYPVSLVVRP